uniref:Large ribosomal subunit protein uL10m n=1 Tax=Lygus hesperus TaxID=30085 RepID=A0A0A9WJL0_LYGHE
MAGLIKEGVLRSTWTPGLQFVRWRRVNVQRPRPPHYDRALALAVLKPQYDWNSRVANTLPRSETCMKIPEIEKYKTRPDNPLERIFAKELKEHFETKKLIAFLHANPIGGEDLFSARVKLKKEGMTLEVYSKYVVKMALQGTPYEAALKLFIAHSALIFCDEPKVGKLIKIVKKIPQYSLMAGVVEGRLLSVTQMQAYSELGDLDSARAQLVATLNSAGSGFVSRLTQAQSNLVTNLNQIIEQKTKVDS